MDEIQIASGIAFDEFGDAIAHLVSANLIDSAIELKGCLGIIFGADNVHYLWTTELGEKVYPTIWKYIRKR